MIQCAAIIIRDCSNIYCASKGGVMGRAEKDVLKYKLRDDRFFESQNERNYANKYA